MGSRVNSVPILLWHRRCLLYPCQVGSHIAAVLHPLYIWWTYCRHVVDLHNSLLPYRHVHMYNTPAQHAWTRTADMRSTPAGQTKAYKFRHTLHIPWRCVRRISGIH